MSTGQQAGGQPSEAEMRAALEQEMKQVRVQDLVLQSAVSILNVGARRVGLAGGGDERDLDQAHTAIEAVRSLMGVIEREAPEQLKPLRDALSQVQMAYVRERGGEQAPGDVEQAAQEPGATEPGGEQPAGGDQGPAPGGGQVPDAGAPAQGGKRGPGPAESSGRLWVPGR